MKTTRALRSPLLAAAIGPLAIAGCGEVREATVHAADWELDLRPVLDARCAACHAGDAPAAGWSVARYTDALACIEPGDGGVGVAARLRRALARDDHAAYVDARVRSAVDAWIAGGAAPRRGVMHDPGIVDPRSPSFHGRALRAARWAPMLDGTRQDACGRCHDGAPARPATVRVGAAAAGATACTTCHTAAAGALDCATCHGEGVAPWPGATCLTPPSGRPVGAHARHVLAGAALLQPLACEGCHPARDVTQLAAGAHGDGVVDVRFDARAGDGARYDAATGACSVVCHTVATSAPPRWGQTQTVGPCTGCHATPPRDHWAGPCTTCHADVNATGTAFVGARFHLNGRVDLGDGSGTCAACHGRDGDPLPRDATHQAHRGTQVTTMVQCSECHAVPATVTAPGHLEDRGAGDLRFGARATARSSPARFEAGACASIACHGEGLIARRETTVSWRGGALPRDCSGCHGAPPPQPHTASPSCEIASCHGSEVERVDGALRIRDVGRAAHIDGFVTAGVPR